MGDGRGSQKKIRQGSDNRGRGACNLRFQTCPPQLLQVEGNTCPSKGLPNDPISGFCVKMLVCEETYVRRQVIGNLGGKRDTWLNLVQDTEGRIHALLVYVWCSRLWVDVALFFQEWGKTTGRQGWASRWVNNRRAC